MLNCWSWRDWFATFRCDHCWKGKKIAFTCKSRFCSSCWKPQSDLRMNKLLSWRPKWISYYHLAFTIPEELRNFFKKNRKALKLLPKVASQTIEYFFDKNYSCKPWVLAVIHSFGAKLNRNPHTHLIITAGWINDDDVFKKVDYIPYKAILSSWKKYLLKNLKERIYENIENSYPEIELMNHLYSQKNLQNDEKSWYIYFSKKSRSFDHALSYIWRYLKRPTISQSRILFYDWKNVKYSYKDKNDWETKIVTCSALEFIWYLIQHIPNNNFHMVYYYWIFANRCKSKYLEILKIFTNHSISHKIFPTRFFERQLSFTWKDPLKCKCWWIMHLHSLTIPWYPTKYFDSW